jgi:hypothetical protein
VWWEGEEEEEEVLLLLLRMRLGLCDMTTRSQGCPRIFTCMLKREGKAQVSCRDYV